MNNYKPTLIIVLSFLFALSACSSPSQPNSAQPSSDVQVRETQNRTVTTTETIRINNCGGRAESKQVSERSFAVSVDASFSASVGYAIVQGTVSAKYGQYRNVSKRQELVAPPGTNMEITLKWTEQEWAGTVLAGNQSGHYHVRAPLEVEQVSSRDWGCGGVQAPTATTLPTSMSPQIVQVPPTQEPRRIPPTFTSASPLRPHTTVSIGSGAFSRVTFSDGQAPYDENWLWANNHFNIQRIRREEQPDGCDVAQYRVSKI